MEPINRKALKENAKIALKHNFWMIMLVVFVGAFLGTNWNGLTAGSGVGNGISRGFNTYLNIQTDLSSMQGTNITPRSMDEVYDAIEDVINGNFPELDFHFDYDESESSEDNFERFIEEFVNSVDMDKLVGTLLVFFGVFLLILLLIWVIATCVQFAVGSFVSAPIGVGFRRFFMKNRKQEGKFMDLFSVFSKGNYMKVVKTMFATNIRIWAWSLLFYFPGVVKLYQYYFVPYIMSENPNISPERARELSRQLTDGHKWQIFVLELSFLGWFMVFVLEEILLALISCGLLAIPGALLSLPLSGYIWTTYAELYEERREYALMTGMATKEELCGF